MGFGALLVLHGANAVQEAGTNLWTGRDDSQGFLKEYYIAGAEFLGFDKNTGEIAYNTMDLSLSAYGMLRLTTKPQTYRLFHYLNTDYVRGIQNMSRLDLGFEIYNDAQSIKSLIQNMSKEKEKDKKND